MCAGVGGGGGAAAGAAEAPAVVVRGPAEYTLAQMMAGLDTGEALPLRDITSMFDLGQPLGSGSFGSVMKCVCLEDGAT